MTRREFITLLGGAADLDAMARVAAFQQGLQQLGWTIGRNVRIEIRWSGGKADEARRYAAELVALAPDVILAHGVSTVRALLQEPRTHGSLLGPPWASCGFWRSRRAGGGALSAFGPRGITHHRRDLYRPRQQAGSSPNNRLLH